MKRLKRRQRACPCHSGRRYADCCGPYHQGEAAPDPVALMRSRYAAYALGDARYIVATTHPDGPHFKEDKDAWRRDVRAFCRATSFKALEILEAEGDTVVFHAGLTQLGRDASFVERSTFAQRDGCWLYLEGEPA